jgi:hypothetical protein
MINKQVITKYYLVKVFIIVIVTILYFLLNVTAVNFLFTAVGFTLTKKQVFMVVLSIEFLSHRIEVSDHKSHNFRAYVHNRLLLSFGNLVKSVVFLFISFGYLVYLS